MDFVIPVTRGPTTELRPTTRAVRWVTSHVFRKTVASLMDDAGTTARAVADQFGHSQAEHESEQIHGRRRGTSDAADFLEILGQS